jgi:hypothetical protein
VGGCIVVQHREHPDYDAGIVWVGSAVQDTRGKRTAQPQEYYDNLLEVKSEVNVSPKYMFKWLEQGAAMEISFRQAKPDAKVRVDSLADQVAKWAHVLLTVTPTHVVETKERREREAAEKAQAEEEKRLAEYKAQMEKAREEARERQRDQLKGDLVREYGDFLYESGGSYYGEDPVRRNQRARVQAQAGFQLSFKTRRNSDSQVDDARAWFELDNSYCKPFSAGEIRAMLDGLRQYRNSTPASEWLPQIPTGEEKEEELIAAQDDESAEVTLDASVLLSVPLPDRMDD